MADFVANLDRINALAETSPGFVWRLQTEEGDATALRPMGENVLVNMSVWRDVASLNNFRLQDRSCRDHAPSPRVVRAHVAGVRCALVGTPRSSSRDRRSGGEARAAQSAWPDGGGLHIPESVSRAGCSARSDAVRVWRGMPSDLSASRCTQTRRSHAVRSTDSQPGSRTSATSRRGRATSRSVRTQGSRRSRNNPPTVWRAVSHSEALRNARQRPSRTL
jgi:Domain of unknown function (DUF3291)